MTIPAGWYDDGSGRRRWWDGSGWTQHTLAAPATPTPTPETPAEQTAAPDAETLRVDDVAADDARASASASQTDPAAAAFTPPWVHPDAASAGQGAAPTFGTANPGSAPATDPGSAPATVHGGAASYPGWNSPGAYPGGSAQPGWGAPTAPPAPRSFPILGVIALGLAVLGAVLSCVPVIAVAGWALLGLGFVLGIVSLFLRAAKWPGLVGMGVSVLGTFLAIAVVLISVGSTGGTSPEAGGGPAGPPTSAPSDDDHAPVPDDAETVGWADLEVGQCIPYVDWDEDVYYVPVVSCDEPHTDEVYFAFDIDDGEFPGDEEISRIADERCVAEFETFVGFPYMDSELDFYWSSPTQRTWRLGDREVICIVYSYDDVTGTLQSAGR